MDFKIRENRGRSQGRKPLVREREEYFRLMDQGLGSREACRAVAISLRTGKRWWNGRAAPTGEKARPSVRWPISPDGPSRYLRQADRLHIADRLREKASTQQIAAELGRSHSTISREIRSNGMPLRGDASQWAYRPHAAQSRAEVRRPRPKAGKTGQNPELQEFIQSHLEQRWSPEQISQVLRTRFPDRPERHVTHETIYQALYVQGRGEVRRELTSALRTGRVRRRPRRQAYKRQPRFTAPMVMISDRPPKPPTVPFPATGNATASSAPATAPRSAHSSSARPASPCWCTCPTDTGQSTSTRPSPPPSASCRPPATVTDRGPGQRDGGAGTSSSPPWRTCRSTSAVPPAHGSADRTRTRTACSGSTSPRAPTCPCTAASTSTP